MVSLTAWVESWIECRSIRLKPSTIDGYRGNLRRYIAPHPIGDMPINEIAPEHIVVLLAPIVAKGYTRQAQLVQILLGAALKAAVKQRILMYNPVDCVDKLQHTAKATPWLNADQARHFLRVAKQRQDPFLLAWQLGMVCGLRRGEILGLKYQDIDFDRMLLHICRQRIRLGGELVEASPKTRTSVRDIPISSSMADMLRFQRRTGYLIECSVGMLCRALDGALQAAELPRITLHGLRHTMAAVAASDGVPIKILQQIMGHAQFSTTADIYAHVDRAALRGAAMQIATRLEIA